MFTVHVVITMEGEFSQYPNMEKDMLDISDGLAHVLLEKFQAVKQVRFSIDEDAELCKPTKNSRLGQVVRRIMRIFTPNGVA